MPLLYPRLHLHLLLLLRHRWVSGAWTCLTVLLAWRSQHSTFAFGWVVWRHDGYHHHYRHYRCCVVAGLCLYCVVAWCLPEPSHK